MDRTEPASGTLFARAKRRLRADPRVRYGALLLALLTCLYALLQNGYWAASGDPEVYMAAARNLTAGNGYTFDGAPIVHYPPGWPLVLAGVLQFTSSFWVFNAVAKLLLLGAAVMYYLLLLRLTTPARAFLCVFTSATLWWWFSNAYLLYSEGLFILLLASALFLARQVTEGRGAWWRIALVALLCASLVAIRWLGLLAVAAIVGTLLSGEFWPRRNRQWLCMWLSVSATFITFACLYGATVGLEENNPIVWSTYRFPLTAGGSVVNQLGNLSNAGLWMADILWPPTKRIVWSPVLLTTAILAGWFLWPFIVSFTIAQARRKQWMLTGILLYLVLLMGRWEVPEGRYLVPFIPLFLLAFWSGLDLAADWLQKEYSFPAFRWKSIALTVVLGSVLLCNLTLYAIDMVVMRSRDFYATYLAGEYVPLIAISQYVRRNVPPEEMIALNGLYDNLQILTYNKVGMATSVMLTDHIIVPTPGRIGLNGPSPQLVEWAEKRHIHYFLFRSPISPWRLWHFRVPRLQRWLTGQREIPTSPYWVLYRIEHGRAVEIRDIPPAPPVTHMPAALQGGPDPAKLRQAFR